MNISPDQWPLFHQVDVKGFTDSSIGVVVPLEVDIEYGA